MVNEHLADICIYGCAIDMLDHIVDIQDILKYTPRLFENPCVVTGHEYGIGARLLALDLLQICVDVVTGTGIISLLWIRDHKTIAATNLDPDDRQAGVTDTFGDFFQKVIRGFQGCRV